jgi:anaphase-promoting complex subunit 3
MYMKRNKMRLAEYHYRKALDINPNNAVILGCMGIVRDAPPLAVRRATDPPSPVQAFQRRGDPSGALVMFDDAIRRAPDNALVRYHRAKLFISMKAYQVRGRGPEGLSGQGRGPFARVDMVADGRCPRGGVCACLQRAVADLEHLRDVTPEESNVVFQLAKVYRLLGDELRSAQTLAVARDVSPKSIGKIRKLLETVKDEGADSSQMEEG